MKPRTAPSHVCLPDRRSTRGFTLIELPVVRQLELPVVRQRRRAAFTLIELLVVVAIIALLISILLPSLKKARDQAKLAVGRANQRNIVLASVVFQGDAGHLPYPLRGVTEGLQGAINESRFLRSWTRWGGWADQSREERLYADELLDLKCAAEGIFADPGNIQHVWTGDTCVPYTQQANLPDDRYPISYLVNIFMTNSTLREQNGRPPESRPRWKYGPEGVRYNHLRTADFSLPGENAWVADQAFADEPPGVARPAWDSGYRVQNKLFGFMDGHVELLKLEEWYATTFWMGYDPHAEDPAFRPRLWDVRHASPQGGPWTCMDENSYP